MYKIDGWYAWADNHGLSQMDLSLTRASIIETGKSIFSDVITKNILINSYKLYLLGGLFMGVAFIYC